MRKGYSKRHDSLHNISNHDRSTPLVIVLPPFSLPETSSVNQLPSCFQDHPVAVINYRWQGQKPKGDEQPDYPLHWPTPLHDVSFGYSWIMENLGSGTDELAKPRPAYVYGSYLGASLAASLALTESYHTILPRPMTVRGLMLFNGIYNWTMFLPDHPVQKSRTMSEVESGLARDPIEEEGIFTDLKRLTPSLFAKPSNLFDPFASACLFFHSPDLYEPDDFTTPLSASSTSRHGEGIEMDAQEEEETADELLARAAQLAKQKKPLHKGHRIFPPYRSTLCLPQALFLYSSPSPWHWTHPSLAGSSSDISDGGSNRRRVTLNKNSFAVQASELSGLMLRSLYMHELLEYRGGGRGMAGLLSLPWEEEGITEDDLTEEQQEWKREVDSRVRTLRVSRPSPPSPSSFSPSSSFMIPLEESLRLDENAERVMSSWLADKIDEDLAREEEGRGRGGDGDLAEWFASLKL